MALYDTLGPDATNYILNHAEVSVIVCSQEKIPKVIGVLHLEIENEMKLNGLMLFFSIEKHNENCFILC